MQEQKKIAAANHPLEIEDSSTSQVPVETSTTMGSTAQVRALLVGALNGVLGSSSPSAHNLLESLLQELDGSTPRTRESPSTIAMENLSEIGDRPSYTVQSPVSATSLDGSIRTDWETADLSSFSCDVGTSTQTKTCGCGTQTTVSLELVSNLLITTSSSFGDFLTIESPSLNEFKEQDSTGDSHSNSRLSLRGDEVEASNNPTVWKKRSESPSLTEVKEQDSTGGSHSNSRLSLRVDEVEASNNPIVCERRSESPSVDTHIDDDWTLNLLPNSPGLTKIDLGSTSTISRCCDGETLEMDPSCAKSSSFVLKISTGLENSKVVSKEIKALGTALEVLEVVEVDALEDDAIFDLRPEGPSRRAISVVA
ncbi:uncharacterized protein LOC111345945 [Stylophora pistillata]|nr:uncharacterized protein LOC111345945 [Stylophora pistillata]